MSWITFQQADWRERPTSKTGRLGQLIFFALGIFVIRSNAQTNSSGFEAFKDRLSKPAARIEIEFSEGEVTDKPKVSIEKASSKIGEIFIVTQSVRSFFAACQSNAFTILQNPERILINNDGGKSPTYASLSFGCGYFEHQAWYRNDMTFVQLENRNSSGANTSANLSQIAYYEDKVWSICCYGLPKLNLTTIHWDGTKLKALTALGDLVSADVLLNESVGTVRKLNYVVQGKKAESAEVSYSYSPGTKAPLIPDIIERRILSAADPITAARLHFKVRILQVQTFDSTCSSDRFTAAILQSPAAVSNGVVLSQVNGKFIPIKSIASKAEGQKIATRLVMGLMVISTVIFAFFILKNKNNETQEI